MSDLTRSPWLRAALLVLAAGLAVYGLASQWTQVQAALAKLDGWDVAGATVSAIAGLGAMMLAWRALLADLGSRLPLPAEIRVMFVGQLGKYVPGAVWAVAAQVELARDYAVPRRPAVPVPSSPCSERSGWSAYSHIEPARRTDR